MVLCRSADNHISKGGNNRIMPLFVKKGADLIATLSRNVTIKSNGIEKLGNKLIEEIESGRLSIDNFSQVQLHPRPDDPWALDWLFVVDTLNFCFWSYENTAKWTVDGYTGYFALCAAINRAMKENVDILNPRFYSTIKEEELQAVLRSANPVSVPLLTERVKCLHEVGRVLLEKFDGSFLNCIKQADNSALKLLSLIVSNFKCYRDEATYRNHTVAFYKRAQILIGDIWACFKGESLGFFSDINEITMFADYRVPQTLLYYEVLEYSDELMANLRRNVLLENGDEQEVEIRGCSIHAVELLKDYVISKIGTEKEVNSVLIDHFLWDFRRKYNDEIEKKHIPFHKTFCIYY